jgi:hypothetical protein
MSTSRVDEDFAFTKLQTSKARLMFLFNPLEELPFSRIVASRKVPSTAQP